MTEVSLRFLSREEYHSFFQCYEPDLVMDPRPYRYQATNVDHQYDFDVSRRNWYPTFGILYQDQVIGLLSLKRIEPEQHKCEIALMLVSDEWKNRGYGTQAMIQGIQLARENYDIRHIWADTSGHNHRMQHVLEKLGFMLIERIPQILDTPWGKADRLVYHLEAF